MIRDAASLCRQLADAADTAVCHDALITFSIPPIYPSTGFGYLHLGEEIGNAPGGSAILAVRQFVEKPDLPTAEAYLRSGEFGWNAGMFIWKAETFLTEARRLAPPLADFIENFPASNPEAFIEREFPGLPKISVDYAILEKARRVLAIRAEFDWDDVGTWTALPAHLGTDAEGNTLRGSTAIHDSRNNIVLAGQRVIALCGVRDLVVVETSDALLICHRDAVQDIKKLQPHLPDAVK